MVTDLRFYVGMIHLFHFPERKDTSCLVLSTRVKQAS